MKNLSSSQFIRPFRVVSNVTVLQIQWLLRKFNKRTSPGEHMAEKHKRNKPRKNVPNTINFKNLLKHYDIEILKKCKDPLECFISEGIYIKKQSPNINSHLENGFIKQVGTSRLWSCPKQDVKLRSLSSFLQINQYDHTLALSCRQSNLAKKSIYKGAHTNTHQHTAITTGQFNLLG